MTIEQYLKKYPDSTLREYHDYLKEEKEKKEQKEVDSIKRREELLKSYTGKCFRVDFNKESTIFFKLDKEIDSRFDHIKVNAYSIFVYDYYGDRRFNIGFEKNRVLNINWLPGQEEWNDRDYYAYSGIISEESFNEIVKCYKVVTEIIHILKGIKND